MKATQQDNPPGRQDIDVSRLDFDKSNPRFPKDIAEGPVSLLIERFVRDERLLEIIDSIGDQGYFMGEPLLVVPSGKKKFVVVEGNRRLAALKLLCREAEAPAGRISIEKAVNEAANRPDKVPCLVFENEDQILRYLGFRHITGIKSWSALQKARYIKRLQDTHYEKFARPEALRLLARATGSKAPYIGQVLTSLSLYEAAEAHDFYGLGIEPDDIDFSVLSTALSYSNIVEYLGLDSKSNVDLDDVNPRKLRNLFQWLFVAQSNQKTIVGESRNLKKLAAIVAEPEAVKELLKDGRLDEAYELSKGPATALSEAMSVAQRRLDAALRLLQKIPVVEANHLDKAEEIYRTAGSLRGAVKMRLEEAAAEEEPPVTLLRRRPVTGPSTKRGDGNG